MAPDTITPQIAQMAACPRLGTAMGPSTHYAVPCTLNICHADPLRRKQPHDLPLTCQADWCLGGDYRRCAYWRNCNSDRISLARFILRQIRTAYAVCTRALQA